MLGSEYFCSKLFEYVQDNKLDTTPTGFKVELADGVFEVIGFGSFRTAYRGPDGYIYKVPRGCRDCNNYEFLDELKLFKLLKEFGISWGPAFTPYKSYHVMVMPEYRPLVAGVDEVDPTTLNQMTSICFDIKFKNLATNHEGVVKLIDGGNYLPDLPKVREKIIEFSKGG